MALRRTSMIELWRQESSGPTFLLKKSFRQIFWLDLHWLFESDIILEKQGVSNIAVSEIVNNKKNNLKLPSVKKGREIRMIFDYESQI